MVKVATTAAAFAVAALSQLLATAYAGGDQALVAAQTAADPIALARSRPRELQDDVDDEDDEFYVYLTEFEDEDAGTAKPGGKKDEDDKEKKPKKAKCSSKCCARRRVLLGLPFLDRRELPGKKDKCADQRRELLPKDKDKEEKEYCLCGEDGETPAAPGVGAGDGVDPAVVAGSIGGAAALAGGLFMYRRRKIHQKYNSDSMDLSPR